MIVRDYRCKKCSHVFTHYHNHGDEAYPPCPECSKAVEWQPGGFNITGVKSKAVDLAQRVAEQDYGLTDMNDSRREGDTAAKLTPTQSKMAQGFWGGTTGKDSPVALPGRQQLLAQAKQATAMARAEGSHPMHILQNRMKMSGASPKPQFIPVVENRK